MAALASDWLIHFRHLLWNCWTEFDKTWQEARSQRPLPSLCFSGLLEKQDGRPGLWLAETFSTSPLKPLNGIQQNLTGKEDLNVLYKVCVFRADRKNKMAALAYRSKRLHIVLRCMIWGPLGLLICWWGNECFTNTSWVLQVVLDTDFIAKHAETTAEIEECLKDIKVLGKKDIR